MTTKAELAQICVNIEEGIVDAKRQIDSSLHLLEVLTERLGRYREQLKGMPDEPA